MSNWHWESNIKEEPPFRRRLFLLLGGILSLFSLLLQMGYAYHLPWGSRVGLWSFFFILFVITLLDYPALQRSLMSRRRFLFEGVILGAWLFLEATTGLAGLDHTFVGFLGEILFFAVRVYLAMLFFYVSITWVLHLIEVPPALLLGASFLLIIGLGTVLLSLPAATTSGGISPVNALFTATSATCVTGLIVLDTPNDFTLFGQSVILLLFQIGGLGLMSFVAFFSLAIGKGLGIRHREVLREVMDVEFMHQLTGLIVFILVSTLLIELGGAILLYFSLDLPASWSREQVFFTCLFQSVSAFCNAGFSLFSQSLMAYVSSWQVNLIVSALIIIGGLGYAVTFNIVHVPRLMGRFFPRFFPHLHRRLPYEIHIRLVLKATLILLVTGTVVFFCTEYSNPQTLGELTFGEKWMAAFFQSVTCRTAGFNTIDIGGMTVGGKFFSIMLMFIGASPGSTGGGIKTITLAILVLTILSIYKDNDEVEVGYRRLPSRVVNQAIVILTLAILIVSLCLLALTLTERGLLEGGNFTFLDLFFESVSAFATVGLSTGVTPHLSPLGKLIVSLTMFLGRVGPLTLVVALVRKKKSKKYTYPEERVMLG